MSIRQIILVALVFLPAILAAILFRQWKGEHERLRPDDPGPGIRDVQSTPSFAESQGRRIFVVRRDTAEINGRPVIYPRRYYFFETVKKQAADTFRAEGVTWIENAQPENQEQLQGLLTIRATDGAAAQVSAMGGAAGTMTGGRATTGLFSGGLSLESADKIRLRDGVHFDIIQADGGRITIKTDGLDVGFDGADLSSLAGVGQIEVLSPRAKLTGVNLSVESTTGAVTVERDVSLSFADERTAHLPRVGTVSGQGPLIFTPATPPAPEGDILQRIGLGPGSVTLENLTVLNFDRFRLSGRHLRASIVETQKPGDPARLRIDDLEVSGEARIESSEGWITGESAKLRLLEDGGFEIVVDGRHVDLAWGTAGSTPGAGAGIEVHGQGALTLRRATPEEAGKFDVHVFMKDALQVVMDRGESRQIEIDGSALDVWLRKLPSNSATKGVESDSLRLHKARIAGTVRGRGTEFAFGAPEVEIERIHDFAGLLVRDKASLKGPAAVLWNRASVDGKNIRSYAIDAHDELVLDRTASPLSDSAVTARGSVVVRAMTGSGATTDEIKGESVTFVMGPPSTRSSVGGRVTHHLKRLVARGSVSGFVASGVNLRGDSLDMDQVLGKGTLEGSPATVIYPSGEDRKQALHSRRFKFERETGSLEGLGSVAAKLEMSPIDLFGDIVERKKSVQGNPFNPPASTTNTWDLQCETLLAFVANPMEIAGDTPGESQAKGLTEIRIKGNIRLKSPRQSLTAGELHYNLVERKGWAKGAPVRIEAIQEAGASDIDARRDFVTAEQLYFAKDSSLFQGNCEAQLWVRRSSSRNALFDLPEDTKTEAAALECISVSCAEDVVVAPSEARFVGKTHFRRGNPKSPDMNLKCNWAVVRFDGMEEGPVRRRGIAQLEGHGDVTFEAGQLAGTGDLVVFKQDIVELSSTEGRPCRMEHRRLGTMQSPRVRFDLKTREYVGSGGVTGTIK